MQKYHVIIAGASFAGLAVASKINGDVLLIDRNDIGAHQNSACGTTVKMVKDIGCEKSILRTFDVATLHTENKGIDIPLPEPFCTIDYQKFCTLLAEKTTAEFLKVDVRGVKNGKVITSKDNFEADILGDYTGSGAVLASSLKENYVNRRMLSFGIETEVPYNDNKLRFFMNPNIIENGVAWLFPCKKTARFGVGSYVGNTTILNNLKKFLKVYKLKVDKIHGGYFCYHLKNPIVKNIFVTGCAASQTLPLTGEGIRRSVYSGLSCGEIIQRILEGETSLEQGQREYKEIILRCERHYDWLLKTQNKLQTLANWKLNLIARLLGIKAVANWAWGKYVRISNNLK
ncbi:MAG: NAD(P)/FAD-dependent oxidoreductase [Candidatus Hydrothermarchaeota archaeon]